MTTTRTIRHALFFGLLTILLSATTVSTSFARADLSPALSRLMADSVSPDREVAVIVFLEDQQSSLQIQSAAARPGLTRDERIKTTSRSLKTRTVASDGPVSQFLSAHSSVPLVRLWVVPAYVATIRRSALNELSLMDGVRLVVPNAQLELVTPVSESPAPALSTAVATELNQLNVPALWRRGLTGKGRLVCSFDTGVQQSHPALVGKWRGQYTSLRSAWFSTVKPDSLPFDRAGHGTHTMGIMVGSTPADTFGVAPDAQWITAGVIDQGKSLNLTIGDILLAYQWVLNPDGDTATTDDVPDVILNSWGIPKGIFPVCDQTFSAAIDNVEAAGVVTIFAAGNEGPNAATIRQPADRATSAINAFCVGAVDQSLTIAGFSSRGPSSCDATQIKPELVAPGVNIRSSTKGSTYVYMSGTSMAAPYIAGLVALMRQYNPEATVAQIKEALLLSARDLGTPGEDNDYGHGFVDASRLTDFLPVPNHTGFSLVYRHFTGSGVAMPGQTTGLEITLTNTTSQIDQVGGVLVPLVSGAADVPTSTTSFVFGVGGSTAVAQPIFQVTFADSVPHGTVVPFRLYITQPSGAVYDSIDFSLVCGVTPPGTIAAHSASNLNVAVSDFGQFGLAPGSIYNTGAAGFRYHNGPNLLFEGGIIVGRNSLQISSAVRDSLGKLRNTDFLPVSPLHGWTDAVGGTHWQGRFADSRSAIPIPITIDQETVDFSAPDRSDMLFVKYRMLNTSPDKLTGLYLGFLADFDLGTADSIGYEPNLNLIWQTTAGGPYVGVVGLKDISSFKTIDNIGSKHGFTRTELFDQVSRAGINITASGSSADRMFILSSSAIDLYSGDSSQVAFAFVAADNLGDLLGKAAEAQTIFASPTGIDDPFANLPAGFDLAQNYPNPFNPSTTISFSLASQSMVNLRVYNVIGQEVRTLVDGYLPAGNHRIEWDGRDNRGSEAASGVYLYRLAAGTEARSKKMVLVR